MNTYEVSSETKTSMLIVKMLLQPSISEEEKAGMILTPASVFNRNNLRRKIVGQADIIKV